MKIEGKRFNGKRQEQNLTRIGNLVCNLDKIEFYESKKMINEEGKENIYLVVNFQTGTATIEDAKTKYFEFLNKVFGYHEVEIV